MWSDWVVLYDCGFPSVCSQMEKDKRLMEASWWERGTEGETGFWWAGPCSVQFSSVTQSCLTFCDPIDCSMPGFPSITNSQSLLKLMSIESVMPSNHLILCCRLLLPPSVFSSIRVFSNESVLHFITLRGKWMFSPLPKSLERCFEELRTLTGLSG